MVPSFASAQQSAGGKIAVIDVAYIKNSDAIKGEVAQIENSMKAYEQEMANVRKTMQQEAELLKQYKPGTTEYAQQEEKLAGMESKVKLETIRKRKELADAEAKIYYDNYQKIRQVVKQVSEYNGIDLVLRYNSEEMELEKQDSVLRGVMKGVVCSLPA
ncbi:MAG: OmpH family outer membrane protein [Pirellulaceae bacterium]